MLSWDLHYVSLLPALLRARAAGVGTVLWGHGYSKQEAGWRAGFRRAAGRLATALLLYNYTTAERYVASGAGRHRVFVALNALDQEPIQDAKAYWSQRPAELARFRERQGIGRGPVLLFVSRLERANRVDVLLRAAARLRERHPGVRVVVIGHGEPEGARLRDLARTLRVDDCVHFVGGLYKEIELAPWFLSADVFVYPANLGLSLLHAFGYGLPVVTGDRREAHNPEVELLVDGSNGLLFCDGDDAALAATVSRMVDDVGLARLLAGGARETVTKWATLERMVDGMAAAIRYAAMHGRQGRSVDGCRG